MDTHRLACIDHLEVEDSAVAALVDIEVAPVVDDKGVEGGSFQHSQHT